MGINYFARRNHKKNSGCFFFLFCAFFLFMVRFHWTMMSKLPSHGRVALPAGGRTRLLRLVLPPAAESPVVGGASPPGNLPEEKRPSTGRGTGKPPRVRRVIPVKLAASTVRRFWQSSFLFFREDIHQFPHQITSGFSLREKNSETHGAPAGQDSVPQRGSQGRARSSGNVENRIPGYTCRYHNTCGYQYIFQWRQKKLARMLGADTAHAWSKKERNKRENRTTTCGSASSGADNWATNSTLLSFGQTKHYTCHFLTSPWTLEGFLASISKTISVGDIDTAVGPLFCT